MGALCYSNGSSNNSDKLSRAGSGPVAGNSRSHIDVFLVRWRSHGGLRVAAHAGSVASDRLCPRIHIRD